jgi:16S rRNA (adenine1518-N6/adenine1519-N6)-dimethyltransferase
MLQKEVVDRIVADPGSDDYGRLTVTIAARAAAEALFEVGPGAFHPPPRVDSAVVRITPRPPPFEVGELRVYDALVTAAFTQRRKQLGNALRAWLPAQEIAAAGIDPSARAETLAPADFASLSRRWLGLQATADERSTPS